MQVNALFTEELTYHIALKPDFFQMSEPVMTVEWYEDELANKNTILFVAEDNQNIIGLIQVMVRNNPQDPIFKKRRYAHIEDLIVAQVYRGSGVGGSLMDAAKKWVTDQKATAIELWVWENNSDAIAFYEHLGYKTVRRAMQQELDSVNKGDRS